MVASSMTPAGPDTDFSDRDIMFIQIKGPSAVKSDDTR